MNLRHSIILAVSLLVGLPAISALADYLYTDANGQHTVFSFVCQSTKLCTGFVLMDSTGIEKATSSNPVRIDPVGTTTQPVTCVSGCIGGGGANAAASATGSAVPTAADYSGLNVGGNLTGQTGRSVGSSIPADVAINDSSGNQISVATSTNQATNGATTSHTCSTSGFSELGCLGQIDDDVRSPIPSGTNNIGFFTPAPNGALVGATPSGTIAPNNTTGVNLKAFAGTVWSIQLGGIGSAPAYLKLYDSASAPTCGSGTPIKRLIIPAASTAADGAGSNIIFPVGLKFSNGIGYCVTTGIGDSDTTAPAASTFLINIDWN